MAAYWTGSENNGSWPHRCSFAGPETFERMRRTIESLRVQCSINGQPAERTDERASTRRQGRSDFDQPSALILQGVNRSGGHNGREFLEQHINDEID